MSNAGFAENRVSNDLHDLVQSEVGSRMLGASVNKAICCLALFWSIFQIWVASPLQFVLAANFGVDWLLFDDIQIREVHLASAVVLAFLLFPISSSEKAKNKIPWFDWGFASIGMCSVLYLLFNYEALSLRIGNVNSFDVMMSVIGISTLLEAARRTVGFAVTVVAILFLLFSHFGPYFGEMLSHKGHSISVIISHQWVSSEGVFGVSLGVSASFVFLYVLFGSLLEKAGAGNFLILLSFSLLRRFTGGPAKAAVVASGLMGMISGSSMANTITVGSLTIPLMKRMGLSASKAAAIEVSAGINGQIMPPVMGASAFIMADYLSMPYAEVVKHAFLPAILVYVALLYIVHLESLRIGFSPSVEGANPKSQFLYSLIRGLMVTSLTFIGFGLIYFAIEGLNLIGFPGLKGIFGKHYLPVISCIIFCVYVLILRYNREEDLNYSGDIPISTENMLSPLSLLRSGMHHFIPLIILVWCLLVEKYSPALAAYWTIGFLCVMLLTQHPIKKFFRGDFDRIKPEFFQGFSDLISALIAGAKNMTVVAIATATAGLIVGSVSLTGLGLKISSLVEYVSGGSVFLALAMTAVICIVLGMGMPTTACYIIVSTIMVPVLDYLLNKSGIATPKFALHLFVFYFGLMADVTPPVGLASYAAAAVAKANPITTGCQAFLYNMRTMTLPFIFIFNPSILLYNVSGMGALVSTVVNSMIGIITVAASTQGYFVIKSRWYESLILLIVGLSLLFPQSWSNAFVSNKTSITLERLDEVLVSEGQPVKIMFKTARSSNDDPFDRVMVLYPADATNIAALIRNSGISYSEDGGALLITDIDHNGYAFKNGAALFSKIVEISTIDDGLYIIAVLIISYALLSIIYMSQRARKGS